MGTAANMEFLKGLQAIEDAIDLECRARRVSNPMVRHNGVGQPHQVEFSIQINGRRVIHRFTSEEVRDSAESLNPSVRSFVRALVMAAALVATGPTHE
jgi:hypothetical protein